ncbi:MULTISPECIES: ABC transporter ATP-binding protein [Desulfobacula]|uniref:LivG2: high affinity branched-chain amino acid transporter ATP-binding protein n=2 Tax=Desulfobacula TaxID=28222 RepID=K0ND71_DESTT|nr:MULTISPECIES: ABC transporter ATP-binding protein [Desulfobacula]CCK78856.1 LivG2: high affinity branched-chain amino acid transporter ATP-binding protein [Desulfobacula toluolica Tol2]SDU10837.1 amino acid/amide ABC transporter ATP-binding protein 1, HAAT family (TC 3.A.1.4.-) [Desulfobacula phenolica]
MAHLTVSDVTLSFGGLKALSNVDMIIEPGLITSIIGPNGAGKTSMLNCISGFYHPTRGDIFYKDKKLTNSSPHQVSNMGIARAFQNLELFSGLSVLDNLLLARHQNLKYSFLHAIFFYGKASRIEAENRAHVETIIDFMELEPYRKSLVGNLSYGVQKKVEVARALTLAPDILLLDEPMAGMNQEEKEDIVRFVMDIQKEKEITVVLVEHDLGVVMDISDQIYVLDFGEVIGSGTPEEVAQNPKVIEAYIGED